MFTGQPYTAQRTGNAARPGRHVRRLVVAALVVAAMCMPTALSAQTDAETARLTELGRLFAPKGHALDSLFVHPSFEIYASLVDRFENAPEKKGGEAYLDALKTGGEEKARETFEDEYARYRHIIGFESKSRALPAFMESHAAHLAECERTYGINKEIIAAVLGVESDYGKVRLKYMAFNVYVSMYVHEYRVKFALDQLAELLAFTERTGIRVFDVPSSYAGAVGPMQFIPYSLNHYFVGDDVNDIDDNLTSIAHYLAYFLKRRGTIELAVRSYNPSNLYVRSVMDLAATAAGDTTNAVPAGGARP